MKSLCEWSIAETILTSTAAMSRTRKHSGDHGSAQQPWPFVPMTYATCGEQHYGEYLQRLERDESRESAPSNNSVDDRPLTHHLEHPQL